MTSPRVMLYSSTSLPPRVEGAERGLLDIDITTVVWHSGTPHPADPILRLHWWGAEHDDTVSLEQREQAQLPTIRFVLRSRFRHVYNYFQDMKVLNLRIESGATGALLGIASLNVAALTPTTPVKEQALQILAPSEHLDETGSPGEILGTLVVSAHVHIPMDADTNSVATESESLAVESVENLPASVASKPQTTRHLEHNDEHQQEITSSSSSGQYHSRGPVESPIGNQSHSTQIPASTNGQPSPSSTDINLTPGRSSSPIQKLASGSHNSPTSPTGYLGKLFVHIESATHLPPQNKTENKGNNRHRQYNTLPAALRTSTIPVIDISQDLHGGDNEDDDVGYHAYVSAVWKGGTSGDVRINTHAATVLDMGREVGCSAVWNVPLSFPAQSSAFKPSKSHLLSASGSINHGSNLNQPFLLLNVWRCHSVAPAACTPGHPSPMGLLDSLIGCAALDLEGLHPGGIKGHFPVVDALENVRGHIKVAVRPDEMLATRLRRRATSPGGGTKTSPTRESTSLIPPAVPAKHEDRDMDYSLGSSRPAPRAAAGVDERWTEMDKALSRLQLSINPTAPAPTQSQSPLDDSIEVPLRQQAARWAGGNQRSSDNQQRSDPKQQFAWSGSDSEDSDMGLVGVAFEGAVSCDEDEGSLGMGLQQESVGQLDRGDRPPMILNNDWLFDISANATADLEGADDQQEQDEEAEDDIVIQRVTMVTTINNSDTETATARQGHGRMFKNRLMPAVKDDSDVPGALLFQESSEAIDNAPTTAVVGGNGASEEPFYAPAQPLPTGGEVPRGGRSFAMNAGMFGVQDDWLFNLNRNGEPDTSISNDPQGQQGGEGGQQPLTQFTQCSQFAPMK